MLLQKAPEMEELSIEFLVRFVKQCVFVYLAPVAAPAAPFPAGTGARPYRGGGVRILRATRDRFRT